MKFHLVAAALFGLGTLTSSQSVEAGDPYFAGDPGTSYGYGERGSYNGTGSLKDPPYEAPLTRSYNDLPYQNGKGVGGIGLPKRPIQYRDNGYGYNGNYCVSRWQLRQSLRRHGWFDFHNRRVRRGVIKINAQRGDGCIFRLRVDRCTGAILRKRLISRPQDRYDSGYGRYGNYPRSNRYRNNNIY